MKRVIAIECWFIPALGVLGMSCGASVLTTDVPDTVMSPDEHLLMEPLSNAEALLGRSVTKNSDAGYEIADALAPGCEVTPRETVSRWTRTFHQVVEDVAGFGANLGKIMALKAKYQEGVRVEAVVSNEKTLTADLRGTCGALVITSVKVGTGRREFQYKKSIEGEAHGGWKSISAGGGGGTTQDTSASLRWDSPQAWAFTVGSVEDSDQADITIDMPETLKPGERFEPRISAGRRDLWLIVLSCDSEQRCVVLRPSSKIPTEVVPAGRSITLWPMDAVAAEDGNASRERMVVYGFPEEGDFKRFAPPAGALTIDESSEYARTVEKRLRDDQEIPSRRWTRTEFRYVVEAASSIPTGDEP